MFFAVVCAYIALHLQIKARKKLFKEYKELVDEHEKTTAKSIAQTFELLSIHAEVYAFVNEHNSWHDRKIAFYFDHKGWHCCYCDEMPQGDVVSEQEEINEPNENNNENNQSI